MRDIQSFGSFVSDACEDTVVGCCPALVRSGSGMLFSGCMVNFKGYEL